MITMEITIGRKYKMRNMRNVMWPKKQNKNA